MRICALIAALLAGQDLTPENVDALRDLIKPRPGEDPYRELPWQTSLWEARREAAKAGKPIFAVLMSGNVQGCT